MGRTRSVPRVVAVVVVIGVVRVALVAEVDRDAALPAEVRVQAPDHATARRGGGAGAPSRLAPAAAAAAAVDVVVGGSYQTGPAAALHGGGQLNAADVVIVGRGSTSGVRHDDGRVGAAAGRIVGQGANRRGARRGEGQLVRGGSRQKLAAQLGQRAREWGRPRGGQRRGAVSPSAAAEDAPLARQPATGCAPRGGRECGWWR